MLTTCTNCDSRRYFHFILGTVVVRPKEKLFRTFKLNVDKSRNSSRCKICSYFAMRFRAVWIITMNREVSLPLFSRQVVGLMIGVIINTCMRNLLSGVLL